jgi:hypothetical protein
MMTRAGRILAQLSEADRLHPADPTARFNDLQKQGFMRGSKDTKPKAERPVIACNDCRNWHREGKHTATPEERRAHRLKDKQDSALSAKRRAENSSQFDPDLIER